MGDEADDNEPEIIITVDNASAPSQSIRQIRQQCPNCKGRGEFGEEFGEIQKCPDCGGHGSTPITIFDDHDTADPMDAEMVRRRGMVRDAWVEESCND